MKHSETFTKLSAALVAAQAQLKAIPKDATNPHFKNRYASLDGIVETIRPVLAAYKLAVIQGAGDPIIDHGGSLEGFSVETMLIHESGEWISNAAIVPLTKVDAQGAGGALTYGRRYGLSALLSLATDEDDDGNAAARPRAQATVAERMVAATKEPAPIAEPEVGEEPSCPKCGGNMWDNRTSKKNPKAPDYKCRTTSCDGVIWPPKNGKAPPKAVPVAAEDDYINALIDDDAY